MAILHNGEDGSLLSSKQAKPNKIIGIYPEFVKPNHHHTQPPDITTTLDQDVAPFKHHQRQVGGIEPLMRYLGAKVIVEVPDLGITIPLSTAVSVSRLEKGDTLTPFDPAQGYAIDYRDFDPSLAHDKVAAEYAGQIPLGSSRYLNISTSKTDLIEAGVIPSINSPFPPDLKQQLHELQVEVEINGQTFQGTPDVTSLHLSEIHYSRFHPKGLTGLAQRRVATSPGFVLALPDDPEKIESIRMRFSRPALDNPSPRTRPPVIPWIAQLKDQPDGISSGGHTRLFYHRLNGVLADKGITDAAVRRLARSIYLDGIVTDFMLRGNLATTPGVNRAYEVFHNDPVTYSYTGTQEENAAIDASIRESSDKSTPRRLISGRGATRKFNTTGLIRINHEAADTPILVVGAGAAGIILARGLQEVGFRKTTVVDAQGRYKGIWNQANVFDGTKNNPFELEMGYKTSAAPGPGSHINIFLDNIVNDPDGRFFGAISSRNGLPTPEKGTVTSIEPGDLDHKVLINQEGVEGSYNFPIVIAALGNGKPLPPNQHPDIKTDVSSREAGIRWQQIISDKKAAELRGRRLLLVGLGNSTAEMMVQADQYGIDYRVVTHYPYEALFNPDQDVSVGKRVYRVARDLTKPNLTKLELDLSYVRDVYQRALHTGKILGGVQEWQMDGNQAIITQNYFGKSSFEVAQVYTLIGYGHNRQTLESLGMTVLDSYRGVIARDYDGEIQAEPGALGRDRLYPGFFAFGSMLRDQVHAPNANVIPGMFHTLYDQLGTIMFRAQEYQQRIQSYRH